MADPSRAERLARTSPEPVYRAYALGCVAVAVAPKDRATARRLIEEAYEILQQCVDTGNRGSRVVQKPTGIAFGLLELVEQIDPTLIREFFRAISLRSSTTFGNVSMSLGPYGDGGRMRLSDPVLAAFLRDMTLKPLGTFSDRRETNRSLRASMSIPLPTSSPQPFSTPSARSTRLLGFRTPPVRNVSLANGLGESSLRH